MKIKSELIKIRAKLSWSLSGNLIYALSQWAIITLIARLGSVQELGIYSLGLAITAPIVIFFNFQLKSILATDHLNEYSFPQYLGARITHVTLAFIIIIPISLIYLPIPNVTIIIILMGMVKYFEALSDICMGLYQKKGKIDRIGKSQLLKGIYSVIFVGITFTLSKDLVFTVTSLLLITILRFFFYDIKYLKEFSEVKPKFDVSIINIAKIAYPLGFTALIVSLNTNIPRYLLDFFLSIKEVGIFSALYYILIAGNMVITPITQLAAPRLANTVNKESSTSFIKLNFQIATIFFILFIMLFLPILFKGDLILRLLYGDNFVTYNHIFIIISLSLFFGFLLGLQNISIIALRELKWQSVISALVLSITFIISYFFIKKWGLEGAAYSLLISRLIHVILYLFLLLYTVKKRWPSIVLQNS